MSADRTTHRRREEGGAASAAASPEAGTGGTATRTRSGTEPAGAAGRRSRTDRRSVPDLLRQLSSEGAELVRKEIALARAEMNAKLDRFRSATASMAVGGALLLAALLTLLWTVNLGLTALLVQWVDASVAAWLSPLILTVVLGLTGYGLVRSGRGTLDDEGLTPDVTAESLREDRRWLESRARRTKKGERG